MRSLAAICHSSEAAKHRRLWDNRAVNRQQCPSSHSIKDDNAWNMNWWHPRRNITSKTTNNNLHNVKIRLKSRKTTSKLKLFLYWSKASHNKPALRKTNHTMFAGTAKFAKENIPSYYVSERSRSGAKQKRGNRCHWRRRWAVSRIIWRKYYEARRHSRCTEREAAPPEVNYPTGDKAEAR